MKYELINCKPVPARLAPELRALGIGKDITLTSGLRTQAAVDYARRRGCSLSSQAELYNGFRRGLPGYNPANPPGRSTHELRSDGVAFSGPAGRPLRYWQVGLDLGDRSRAQLACSRARKRGWIATITYPNNPREGHHVNFRREPIIRVFRPLKKGAKGPRVAIFTARLAYLGYLPGVSPKRGTGGFGDKVEDAVKAFQKKHGLRRDGIYGKHTAAQLRVDVRGRKKCRKAALKRKTKVDRDRHLRKCGKKFGPDD